jgi:hypothetical protein
MPAAVLYLFKFCTEAFFLIFDFVRTVNYAIISIINTTQSEYLYIISVQMFLRCKHSRSCRNTIHILSPQCVVHFILSSERGWQKFLSFYFILMSINFKACLYVMAVCWHGVCRMLCPRNVHVNIVWSAQSVPRG